MEVARTHAVSLVVLSSWSMDRHAALQYSVEDCSAERMHFRPFLYVASIMKLHKFRFGLLSNGSHKRYNHIERQSTV